jgi:formylglycine-generating enzyme required for sulfatase activity/serine/threonine protein kinase
LDLPDTLGLIGTTVADKYLVERVVGEGGFATVYRAKHLIWKRPVALKVFKALGDFAAKDREKLLEEFIQEGSLLADLSERSAAICQARDIGMLTAAGGAQIPYMVLEWLEGETLEQTLTREKSLGLPLRSVEDAVRLLEPAAEALALAHKKGIAHRDVKPGNLFLLGDPRSETCAMKLLDFGIAKVVSHAQKMTGGFAKTSGAVTSFTPAYGAPEQFSRTHGSTGPWTDVFAFALIMTEVLTGKEPLDGDDYVQLAVSSAHPARRPTPATLGASTSPACEAIFQKALAVKPDDRYASMGEFWNALRGALHMAPLRAITTTGRGSSIPDVGHAATVVAPASADAGVRAQESAPLGAPSSRGTAASIPSTSATNPKPASSKAGIVAAASVAAVIGTGALVYFLAVRGSDKAPLASAPSSPSSAGAGRVTLGASSATAAPSVTGCPVGMIAIPGGRFYMGSDFAPDEKPAHQVTLAPFCIDKHEVTVADFKGCSDKGGCLRASQVNEVLGMSEKEHAAYDPLCNIRNPAARAKHPINCVDFDQAITFCKEQGKRLPTEAEWEFAARGPDGRKYPWGDEEPTATLLNACDKECVEWGKKAGVEVKAMYLSDDGFGATAPVGSFPKGASRYGVEDVVGNVWEWVADYYGPYSKDEQNDPHGAPSGDKRVIRGGAWNGSQPSWVRPTFRYRDDPSSRSHGIGFRCAR